MDVHLTFTALERAYAFYPAPAIHHSDQSGQYATPDYTGLLADSTQISMSAKGWITENGIVEHFIRTFKEEHFDYTEYDSSFWYCQADQALTGN